jgi:predicted phage-related endonuclease
MSRRRSVITSEMTRIQLVRKLVQEARADTNLWNSLIKAEKRYQAAAERGDADPAQAIGAANVQLLVLKIADFLDRHGYEDVADDDDVYNAMLTMVRCFVRKELGFPVDVDWDLDDINNLN